jgi:hypothetical protein
MREQVVTPLDRSLSERSPDNYVGVVTTVGEISHVFSSRVDPGYGAAHRESDGALVPGSNGLYEHVFDGR